MAFRKIVWINFKIYFQSEKLFRKFEIEKKCFKYLVVSYLPTNRQIRMYCTHSDQRAIFSDKMRYKNFFLLGYVIKLDSAFVDSVFFFI